MADEQDRDEHDEQGGAATGEKTPQAAKGEFLAALGHLKNAAELLVGAADPAVRKAATQAEKALEKVGREAEPMARQLGAELGKMTRSLVDVLEGKPRGDAAASADESDIERLEREAASSEAQREDDDEKKG
ncbi:MAG: hypothetical protein M3Y87_14020 [Myxococcota bacterium]|nr:hypothetical protein [Myxococcota bacterium]